MQLFVVGAGYVGLTTAVGLAESGHDVVVHDIDRERVAELAAGRSPIFEPGLEDALQAAARAGLLSFTPDPTPPSGTAMAIVCVPTPTAANGLLDVSIVADVVRHLGMALAPDALIVIRSTLPLHGPEALEAVAADPAFPAVVVNPEFMREGRALADVRAPSRIAVGALTGGRVAADRVLELYAHLDAPIVVGDARSVVLLKLAANVFLGLKVAFADELARLADAIGADVTIVADGIGLDPRIGRSFLDSGPGFGGSCLPEQAAAIASETASRDVPSPLLASIATSNRTHQAALAGVIDGLTPGGVRGRRVALLGLAFKADTDDVRHSPALALAGHLRSAGATVVGYDPVAGQAARRADPALETAATPEAAAAGAAAVVLVTEWSMFRSLEWTPIARAMTGDLVYDARRIADAAAVAAAGLRYVSLGRAAVGA